MGYIYKISNNIDDRVYIGSTINLNKRWNEHRKDLSNNRHQNIHLQRFANKYGLDSLKFDILELVDDNIILVREQYHIDNTKHLFNISTCATAPMKGKTHTIESLAKIAQRSAGVNNPMYGKKRPQWLIDKLVTFSLGRKKSIEEKAKRTINSPNRIELIIENSNIQYNCFSISHAAAIIGVKSQSISKAIKNNRNSMGWTVLKSNENFYNKEILLNNLHLFNENCHPQPELISMLKSLK